MIASHALDALNDHTLLSQFGELLRQDHEDNAHLLRHIDAVDRRQLWAKLGYPSLFALLVSRHHMSEYLMIHSGSRRQPLWVVV